MRILYIGFVQGFLNGSKYYFIPQKLINGFTRLGHNVYIFNDRDCARYNSIFKRQNLGKAKMNADLIAFCREYQPELLVLGHCKNVTNETLAEIRKFLPEVKIMYSNVDPLSSKQNLKDINQRVGNVEGIFITTAGERLKQFSNNFGGVYFMPNPVDPALDTKCAFENPDADIDFLFLASYLRDQHDHRHITGKFLLENKGDLNVYIGGAGINDNRVYGPDYFRLLKRAKMGLCMNKVDDYYLYASDRMSQYMASGICAFIPEGSQFEDVLGDNAFISFNGNEELIEKIRFYHKNDTQRIEIAKTGYKRIHDFFHVDKLCQYMLERVYDKPLSQEYNWPTDRY